jgi:hypothetical protein
MDGQAQAKDDTELAAAGKLKIADLLAQSPECLPGLPTGWPGAVTSEDYAARELEVRLRA